MYGAGQWRYLYQGHDIIEHGGHNLGYRTQVARFPNDNLGTIILSKRWKWKLFAWSCKIPHRRRNSWTKLIELERQVIYFHFGVLIAKVHPVRYEKKFNEVKKAQQLTPRLSLPKAPSGSFAQIAKSSYSHPTYGILRLCLVPGTVNEKLLRGLSRVPLCATNPPKLRSLYTYLDQSLATNLCNSSSSRPFLRELI